MYHVPMCLWCGKQEVGTFGGSDSFCSDACRDAANDSETLAEREQAEADAEMFSDAQARSEADADAYFAQYDDDPSPYGGTYSEV